MESFNGRFKTEGGSLFLDAQNMSQLIGMVDHQMNYYNEVRRHSSIGQVSPLTYIEQVRTKRE
jgi:transposase InsO family protein